MFSISIHELYPVAIKLSNRNIASYSLLIGMGLCYAILEGIEMYFGHVHHGHSHPDEAIGHSHPHGPTCNHDHAGHDHFGHHH